MSVEQSYRSCLDGHLPAKHYEAAEIGTPGPSSSARIEGEGVGGSW